MADAWERFKDITVKRWKSAFRVVTHAPFEYLPFIVCLFAMIFTLFTVSCATRSAYASREKQTEAAYDYHAIVRDLDESQMIVLRDRSYSVFLNDYVHETVDVRAHRSENKEVYDVYIRFLTGNKVTDFFSAFRKDTLKNNLKTFRKLYADILTIDEHTSRVIELSPLYRLESARVRSRWAEIGLLAVFALVFGVLLALVYRIRTNHQKFLYGVYATFGADRSRLTGTSVLELYLCAAFAYFPATIASSVFCRIFLPDEHRVCALTPASFVLAILFTLPVIPLAILLPIRSISRAETMTLITSNDNTNLVCHPHSSAKRGIRFPFGYEATTLLRFRSRLIALLLLSSLLSSLFVCGLYGADLYRVHHTYTDAKQYDYHLTFQAPPSELSIGEIRAIKGVKRVLHSPAEVSASSLTSHVLLSKENTDASGKLYTYAKDPAYVINDDFTYYSSAGGDALRALSLTYEIDGDLSGFDNEYVIAIGDTTDNRNLYHFAVGDTVQIALFDGQLEEETTAPVEETTSPPEETTAPAETEETEETTFGIDAHVSGANRLDYLVENYAFRYITCTVGAVIHDYPSALYRTPLILSDELFTELTGNAPPENEWDVYLDTEAAIDPEGAEGSIRDVLIRFNGATITASGAYQNRTDRQTKTFHIVLLACAWMALLLIPVVWLFSQILFYRRRFEEYDILSALAAYDRDIRSVHRTDAYLIGGVSLVTFPIALGVAQLLYTGYTVWIPDWFMRGADRVVPMKLPFTVCLISALLTVLSVILSCFVPLILYRAAKRSESQRQSFSEE